jgi:hypothetical protein
LLPANFGQKRPQKKMASHLFYDCKIGAGVEEQIHFISFHFLLHQFLQIDYDSFFQSGILCLAAVCPTAYCPIDLTSRTFVRWLTYCPVELVLQMFVRQLIVRQSVFNRHLSDSLLSDRAFFRDVCPTSVRPGAQCVQGSML